MPVTPASRAHRLRRRPGRRQQRISSISIRRSPRSAASQLSRQAASIAVPRSGSGLPRQPISRGQIFNRCSRRRTSSRLRRRQRDSDIVVQFGQGAAGTDQRHGTEVRVTPGADDQFDLALVHPLHQPTLDLGVRQRAADGTHNSVQAARSAVASAIPSRTAPMSLLWTSARQTGLGATG